jgi:hypothetical protein
MPEVRAARGWELMLDGWWARALARPDGYQDTAPVPQLRDPSPRSFLCAIQKMFVAGARPLLAASILSLFKTKSQPNDDLNRDWPRVLARSIPRFLLQIRFPDHRGL